jgi:hypothetical protein
MDKIMHIYKKHQNSDMTTFGIIQYRDDGYTRKVSEDHQLYNEWIQQGNVPEIIPYIPPATPELDELKDQKKYELDRDYNLIMGNVYPLGFDDISCDEVQDRLYFWKMGVINHYSMALWDIKNALNETQLNAVTWDFQQFEDTKPDIRPEDMYNRIRR